MHSIVLLLECKREADTINNMCLHSLYK